MIQREHQEYMRRTAALATWNLKENIIQQKARKALAQVMDRSTRGGAAKREDEHSDNNWEKLSYKGMKKLKKELLSVKVKAPAGQ